MTHVFLADGGRPLHYNSTIDPDAAYVDTYGKRPTRTGHQRPDQGVLGSVVT